MEVRTLLDVDPADQREAAEVDIFLEVGLAD